MSRAGDIKAISKKLLALKKAISDEDLKNLSVVDEGDVFGEGDAADKWLAEQEGKAKEKKAVAEEAPAKSKKQYMRDWSAPAVDDEDIVAKIKSHMDEGYSEREAHRLAGTHKEDRDFMSAMKSGISPSMMSQKMIETLKPLAQEWLQNHKKMSMQQADPDKNPMKYAAGKSQKAYEDHAANYQKAYDDFLNSDELKGMKRRDRHKAVEDWKKNWHAENPEYQQGLVGVSSVDKEFGQARERAKQNLNDKINTIMTMGATGQEMDTETGMQHVGSDSKNWGEDRTGAPQQSRLATIGAKNPKLMEVLNQDRQDRMNRVNSAAKAQGVVRTRKGEGDA